MGISSVSLSRILANIDEAWRISRESRSARIAAVVSGNELDRASWQEKLKKMSPYIFNRDESTLVLSLIEKTGHKTREGNFLGTLLAYKNIKEAAGRKGVSYQDCVIMVGMLFGRGERISPITQAKGGRKPAIEVTPEIIDINGSKKAFTAIEEALLYFAPVAVYLEKGGFRGILNKWGDETEIASINLTRQPEEDKFSEYDVIKFIQTVEITDELARQKDWVVFDGSENMIEQFSRNKKSVLIETLKGLGIKSAADGKYYAGVSLGPAAISHKVLDIALEIFAEEIEKEGVYFDFDPYFLMALAMNESDVEAWQLKTRLDAALGKLMGMIPDFFQKVQSIKKVFKKKYARNLNLKIFDLGENTYWVDIGQHRAMRRKFLWLKDKGTKGVIARKIACIPEARASGGNIIVNSEVAPGIKVENSVIVNSRVTGAGRVTESVIIDSEISAPDMEEAFAVRSVRRGKTVLKQNSGLYESLGMEDLVLEKGTRHVSVLLSDGKIDMMVSEDTDLRDKEKTYNVPIFGNGISFKDAYDRMFGTSKEEIEKRRKEIVNNFKGADKNETKQLKFGTSGLRDEVKFMTDRECYINTSGFISFLKEKGEIAKGDKIAFGGDRRGSTPRIMAAVSNAIEDAGCFGAFCGLVPSPTLAFYAITRGMPSIMVTGSHIPEDRNGIKFTKKSGEVLKSDEKDILRNVSSERSAEEAKKPEETLFNKEGMFTEEKKLPAPEFEEEAIDGYIKRYSDVFSKDTFRGRKIALYQHSAVGRDILKRIFEELGAEVIPVAKSEKFVPVDTEKISRQTRTLLKETAEKYKPFAIVSTDGDSDRPLLADETGEFLTGDKLGALVALYLKPDFAAIPISANDVLSKVLTERQVKIEHTKIGSPYVVKAMMDELKRNPKAKVVSWESNGGFLLGSDWMINGKVLRALPTRDAALPLIVALLSAARKKKKMSEFIDASLPARYTYAEVIDDKTKNCEEYTAEMGKTIIKKFSPEEAEINQAEFEEKKIKVFYSDKVVEIPASAGMTGEGISSCHSRGGGNLYSELTKIRNCLAEYFTKERGFSEIISINWIDGIRITFENGDVSHLRPSGNAPEFRNYGEASTQARAEEIVARRFEIISEMINFVGADPCVRRVSALE